MPKIPSIKEINSHPIASVLYALMAAVVVLFGVIIKTYASDSKERTKANDECRTEVKAKDITIKELTDMYLKTATALSASNAKWDTYMEFKNMEHK